MTSLSLFITLTGEGAKMASSLSKEEEEEEALVVDLRKEDFVQKRSSTKKFIPDSEEEHATEIFNPK